MFHRILVAVGIGLLATACSGATSDTTASPAPATTATTNAVPAVSSDPSADCPTEGDEFETAKLYIEHNATDSDTGVHGLFGGIAWRELCIWDPNGQLIIKTDPIGPLHDLAMADLFFESREPSNDEVSIADIRQSFPAGEYMVGGTDFEGTPRVGAAAFSHAMPAEPNILTPELAEDLETAGEAVVSPVNLIVAWEPVTDTIDGTPVDIVGYEVIVTMADHDDPHALSRPIYDVHVGPDHTSLSVPDDFLEPDTVYELEVLALEATGNQTISLGFFATAASGEALE